MIDTQVKTTKVVVHCVLMSLGVFVPYRVVVKLLQNMVQWQTPVNRGIGKPTKNECLSQFEPIDQ